MGALPMWDPHVKAFLLLQAHFSRGELPVSDYVGDQISVLDQSIRVMQAAIDVLAELGFSSSCMAMVSLLQCVKSARWPTDYAASILPGVSPRDSAAETAPRDLVSLISQVNLNHGLEAVTKALHVPDTSRSDFASAAAQLPRLDVAVASATAVEIGINLTRTSARTGPGLGGRELRVYAPHFPKTQTEGYFILAANRASDGVVALKRAGWSAAGSRSTATASRSNIRVTSTLKVPGQQKVDIHVMSDSYPGMQWLLPDVEIPEAPRVIEMDARKEKD